MNDYRKEYNEFFLTRFLKQKLYSDFNISGQIKTYSKTQIRNLVLFMFKNVS